MLDEGPSPRLLNERATHEPAFLPKKPSVRLQRHFYCCLSLSPCSFPFGEQQEEQKLDISPSFLSSSLLVLLHSRFRAESMSSRPESQASCKAHTDKDMQTELALQ